MASKTLYDPKVREELGNAFAKTRPESECHNAIAEAGRLVSVQAPIVDVMTVIIDAMRMSSNLTVLFSLSQAVAWIGPMAE